MPKGIKKSSNEQNCVIERIPKDLVIEMKILCSVKNITFRVAVITAMKEMLIKHREEIEHYIVKLREKEHAN